MTFKVLLWATIIHLALMPNSLKPSSPIEDRGRTKDAVEPRVFILPSFPPTSPPDTTASDSTKTDEVMAD